MEYNYTWVNIYQELADKILEYKNNRKELINKIYTIFSKSEDLKLAKLEEDNEGNSIKPYDIDPFTIFGIFNKKMKDENRTKIIQGFKDEFSLKSDIPKSFKSIPLVSPLKATFYYFNDIRQEDDIDNLWELFQSALSYSKNSKDNENFIKYFNKVIKQKGIKWNITLALFWIRPYTFLSLDSKNRKFLTNKDNIEENIANKIKNLKNEVPDGEEYLTICNECKNDLNKNKYDYSNFIELSYKAFEPTVTEYSPYTEKDFLHEAYITLEEYNTLKNLLKFKKNLIIQGAPGTGKTFIAKRLAYSIIGLKDPNRVHMIQFHQSYSYEDFIMGYKPKENGFELKNGTFYKFCKKAEQDNENDYFFIIDEINRGNLSKIFGEIFMLIEKDKRGSKNKIQLVYSDETFSIPENLYIIGLMNTSDRSLAMIDYALRRRFAFFNLKPGFNTKGFKKYQEKLNNTKFNKLINLINDLNEDIKQDNSLGEGFCIGHSYFSNLKKENLNTQLSYITEYEIIPLLNEYWFDEPNKVENWTNDLKSLWITNWYLYKTFITCFHTPSKY